MMRLIFYFIFITELYVHYANQNMYDVSRYVSVVYAALLHIFIYVIYVIPPPPPLD